MHFCFPFNSQVSSYFLLIIINAIYSKVLYTFYHRIPWNGKQEILIDRCDVSPTFFFFWAKIHLSTVTFLDRYINIRCFFFISRFDGRALLDFIRDSGSRHFRVQEKSEEEEEVEEFVNFERYRDLIKHRRRGCRYFFIFYFYMMS